MSRTSTRSHLGSRPCWPTRWRIRRPEATRFRGTARYDKRTGLSELDEGNDRDYARVDLTLKWMMTQKWYLGGGYSYIWEDRELAASDAANNRFFINFGFQGLSRQALGDRQ